MLIVKIMGRENTADDDTRKSHKLITGVRFVEFDRDAEAHGFESPAVVIIDYGDEKLGGPVTVPIWGNVYVMNEAGRTVSSFGAAPIVYPEGLSPTTDAPQRP